MRYLEAMQACPPGLQGNIYRIRDYNPPQWARLTRDGPIEIGPFEGMVVEVAWTTYSLGWEAAKDLHHIELPRWLLPAFRQGIGRCIQIFQSKTGTAGVTG